MLKNKKKFRTVVVCAAMTLLFGVGGASVALSANATEAVWSEVTLEQVYQIGDVVAIPDCEITYDGEKYTALKAVVYPSGKVKNDDSFVASESGKYTLRYQATIDGEVFKKEVDFVVMNEMYGMTNKTSTVTYGTSSYLPSDMQGLKLSLAKDDVFTFNQVIDVSNMTKDDMICKFYLTPEESGNGKTEASSLKIMLTDIYDPENTVTIHYKNTVPTYLNGNSTYTVAGASGQTTSGWEWKHSYKGPAKDDYVYEKERWFDVHTDDFYGFYSGVRSNGTASGDFVDNYNFFAMNYEERKVYQQYSWYKTWDEANLVADLDDTRVYPDNAWKGFTTGEVILSIWGEGYNTASLNLFITEIADCDLTKFNFIDVDAPDLTVDFGDYTQETYPNAIVGKPYTVFDATAYDVIDGNVNVETYVYYNYYGSSKALCQIKDGAFTPKRAGNYTIVYETRDNMGNVTRECVDVNALSQTETLRVALGAKTTTYTVGEDVTVATYEALNATGKVKGEVVAVLKSDASVCYPIGEDRTFRPLETGVFEIRYTVSDYIETATQTYEVTVKGASLPLIFSDVVLPRALIKNCTYDFPTLKGYDYSSGERLETVCELYVSADGANEIKLEDNSWKVTATNTVRLVYKATNASGAATKEYVLPVVDTGYNDFGALKLNNYFIGEGFTSVAGEEGVSYVAQKNGGNARLSFVNKVLLNEFKMNFAFDAENANFSTLRLALTDMSDATVKLDVAFAYKNGVLTVKIGDSSETYTVETDNGAVDLYYNASTRTLLVNNAQEIPLTEFGFEGFKGTYAYLDFTFEKCSGSVGLEIRRMFTQNFSAATVDEIAPSIYESNKLSSLCTLGDTIVLNELEFYDVLDPNVTATLEVFTPKGTFVETVDGIRLDGAATAKASYQFVVSEYGLYSIEYKVTDYTGNIKRYSFVLNSRDVEPPVITLVGGYTTKAEKGDEITIAEAAVADNYSEDVNVYAFVYYPDGTIAELTSDEFTANKAGTYTVYYYAFDAAGNASMAHYQIEVA